jgi:hypothetical protein
LLLLVLGRRWRGGVYARGHRYKVTTATHFSTCHQSLLLQASVVGCSSLKVLLRLLDLPTIESIVN